MFKIKSYMDRNALTDKIVNDALKVINKEVFLTINGEEYMYFDGNWHFKVDTGAWVNLQGGVPHYEIENNLDENLFEEINNTEGEINDNI